MLFKKQTSNINVLQIKKRSFFKKLPLDDELIQAVQQFKSHDFLVNPAGQNIYLFLTYFVKKLAQDYFDVPLSELRILDWGCGKGHVSYLLQKQGFQVTSCDVLNESGDSTYGQTTPIIENFRINIVPLNHPYELPFKNNSMDIVVSFGVLEHVPNDLASLKEIERILKPNGLFFCFNLPYVLSWTQNLAHRRGDYYHDRLYSKSKVCHLLNLSGLSLLDLWHRQLLPKNSIRYRGYRFWETVDQVLTEYTPLRYLATNIEFVAAKKESKS